MASRPFTRPGLRVAAALLAGSALLASTRTASAADPAPDPAAAFIAGAGTQVLSFAIGGAVAATGHGDHGRDNAGWVGTSAGLTLAPFVAHGMVGEWGRGLAFAAVPAAATAGMEAVFAVEPGTVVAVRDEGLWPQRAIWSCLVLSFIASTVGVIDAAFAGERAVAVVPHVGLRDVGLSLEGRL